jgi:hypothetical protein
LVAYKPGTLKPVTTATTNSLSRFFPAYGWKSKPLALRVVVDSDEGVLNIVGKMCLVGYKPSAVHPVTTATMNALTCICFSGLRPEIQATRYAGGR